MKKFIFVSLFGSLFLLAACGAPSSNSTSSDTQSTNVTSTTTSEEKSSTIEETTSSSVLEESSNTQSAQVQATVSSTESPEVSSETTTPTSSTNNDQSVFTPDQEQALQMLYNNKPELKDPDISFAFFKMIGSDYLFKATSISIRQQGGSGTIGFYRVSPQGIVTETDPSGNPY